MTSASATVSGSRSVEETASAVEWLMPYVLLLPSAAAQGAYLGRISERLGVDLDALRADLRARLPRGDRRQGSPDVLPVLREALAAVRSGHPAATAVLIGAAIEELHQAAHQAGEVRDAA